MATGKAIEAYGEAINRDLARALECMKNREGWLESCCKALSIKLPKVVIIERLDALQRRLLR